MALCPSSRRRDTTMSRRRQQHRKTMLSALCPVIPRRPRRGGAHPTCMRFCKRHCQSSGREMAKMASMALDPGKIPLTACRGVDLSGSAARSPFQQHPKPKHREKRKKRQTAPSIPTANIKSPQYRDPRGSGLLHFHIDIVLLSREARIWSTRRRSPRAGRGRDIPSC